MPYENFVLESKSKSLKLHELEGRAMVNGPQFTEKKI